MATLNRSKDFATVFGLAGHKYEQGGKLFDPDGREVDKNGRLIEGQGPSAAYLADPVCVAYTPPPVASVIDGERNLVADIPIEETQSEETDLDRDTIMDTLDKMGVEYDARLRKSKLKGILDAAIEERKGKK